MILEYVHRGNTYVVRVQTLFLGHVNSRQYIKFTNNNQCGIVLEKGEYVLGLNYVSPASSQLILGQCGLARKWRHDAKLTTGTCGACNPPCAGHQARGNVGSMVFARVVVSFRVDGFV